MSETDGSQEIATDVPPVEDTFSADSPPAPEASGEGIIADDETASDAEVSDDIPPDTVPEPLAYEVVFQQNGAAPITYAAPKKADPQIIVDGPNGNGIQWRSHHLVAKVEND